MKSSVVHFLSGSCCPALKSEKPRPRAPGTEASPTEALPSGSHTLVSVIKLSKEISNVRYREQTNNIVSTSEDWSGPKLRVCRHTQETNQVSPPAGLAGRSIFTCADQSMPRSSSIFPLLLCSTETPPRLPSPLKNTTVLTSKLLPEAGGQSGKGSNKIQSRQTTYIMVVP